MYEFRPCKRTNKIGHKKISRTPSRASRPSFAYPSIPAKAPCWASIKLNACTKGPPKMIWSNNQLPAETQQRQLAFRDDRSSNYRYMHLFLLSRTPGHQGGSSLNWVMHDQTGNTPSVQFWCQNQRNSALSSYIRIDGFDGIG